MLQQLFCTLRLFSSGPDDQTCCGKFQAVQPHPLCQSVPAICLRQQSIIALRQAILAFLQIKQRFFTENLPYGPFPFAGQFGRVACSGLSHCQDKILICQGEIGCHGSPFSLLGISHHLNRKFISFQDPSVTVSV